LLEFLFALWTQDWLQELIWIPNSNPLWKWSRRPIVYELNATKHDGYGGAVQRSPTSAWAGLISYLTELCGGTVHSQTIISARMLGIMGIHGELLILGGHKRWTRVFECGERWGFDWDQLLKIPPLTDAEQFRVLRSCWSPQSPSSSHHSRRSLNFIHNRLSRHWIAPHVCAK
jgi:hypothetical protein